jgi:glycosyltransferase involved in cell wall biosynthesis
LTERVGRESGGAGGLRRPRICFIAPNAYPILAGDTRIEKIGGAELQQVFIARGLASRGYPVTMVCLDFGQDDAIVIDGIRVLKAFRPAAGLPLIRFIWPRLSSLWRSMQRADADIYYQRAASMHTGLLAVFCQLKGRKSIFAAAGDPSLERNTNRIRYKRDRLIYEYGLRHVDRILVQNQYQAELCRRNFSREPILVPNLYEQTAPGVVQLSSEVLWVSMIRKLKQPEIVLELASALPQYHFRLIGGAGPGDQALYDSIKSRASALSNVDFMGFVPFEKVEGLFDRAAIFLNTSESEGFPNAFLQSWARGIPTISFVDCGARLQGQPLGRIVASVEEMQRAINELMSDTARREAEGRRCLEYYRLRHSPDGVLDQYEEIISGLIAE